MVLLTFLVSFLSVQVKESILYKIIYELHSVMADMMFRNDLLLQTSLQDVSGLSQATQVHYSLKSQATQVHYSLKVKHMVSMQTYFERDLSTLIVNQR
jgi:hypothetical protein